MIWSKKKNVHKQYYFVAMKYYFVAPFFFLTMSSEGLHILAPIVGCEKNI